MHPSGRDVHISVMSNLKRSLFVAEIAMAKCFLHTLYKELTERHCEVYGVCAFLQGDYHHRLLRQKKAAVVIKVHTNTKQQTLHNTSTILVDQ